MPKKPLEAIEEHFCKVSDPRKDRTKDHKLIDQDFRLCRQESMNTRCSQFCPQIIAQQIIFGLVKCFAESLGFDFQGQPGMITTSDVIAL